MKKIALPAVVVLLSGCSGPAVRRSIKVEEAAHKLMAKYFENEKYVVKSLCGLNLNGVRNPVLPDELRQMLVHKGWKLRKPGDPALGHPYVTVTADYPKSGGLHLWIGVQSGPKAGGGIIFEVHHDEGSYTFTLVGPWRS